MLKNMRVNKSMHTNGKVCKYTGKWKIYALLCKSIQMYEIKKHSEVCRRIKESEEVGKKLTFWKKITTQK